MEDKNDKNNKNDKNDKNDKNIKKLLVAIDFSECSEHVLQFAIENLTFSNSQDTIFLVNVIGYEHFGYMDSTKSINRKKNKLIESAKSKIRKYEDLCTEKNISFVTKIIVNMNKHGCGESIVKSAEEENCHAIVLGTRGYGSVKQLFFKSLTKYCLKLSKKPVVVVKR